MTLGSLREQLCYPLDKNRFSDDHLKAVLEEVKLLIPKSKEREGPKELTKETIQQG